MVNYYAEEFGKFSFAAWKRELLEGGCDIEGVVNPFPSDRVSQWLLESHQAENATEFRYSRFCLNDEYYLKCEEKADDATTLITGDKGTNETPCNQDLGNKGTS